MNRSDQTGSQSPSIVDRAVEAVRAERVPADEAAAAGRRVWQRVQAAEREAGAATSAAAASDPGLRITGCADVRALLEAYRGGTLSKARALLVEMHLRDCAACRAAHSRRGADRLRPWRDRGVAAATVSGAPWRFRWMWVGAAAAVVLGVGALLFGDAFTVTPGGARATLDKSRGPVWVLGSGGQRALQPGGELHEREWLRTPRDSQATLVLRDGSQVEMKPHTELGVSMNRHDVKVHLERGSIIVHAAKQRTGALIVATDDARVVVTGTVFSVNRGTKGTRVSVLEGTVRIDWRGEQRMLGAGQQLSTSRFINTVPIAEEIAWSGQVQQLAALLKQHAPAAAGPRATPTFQVRNITKDLDEDGLNQWQELRYGSRLMDRLPAETVLYVAVPNYKDALDGARGLIDKQIRDNAVLNPWWKDRGGQAQPALAELFRGVRAVAEHLGDEIVLSLAPSPDGRDVRPLVLAEVKRPGLRAVLERELATMGAGKEIQLLDRASLGQAPAGDRSKLVMLVDDALVALASQPGDLQRLLAGAGSTPSLTATPFGQRLADSYRDGAGVLFAADLAGIAARAGDTEKDRAVLRDLGAADARFLVAEQEHLGETTQNRATLSFAGPRTGVASWLGAPAPMGALDFVTPGASFAAAFVVKQPALVFDDLFRMIQNQNSSFTQELAALEARTAVELRADLAATLGNDVVVAIDGPLLPVPSWKLVMEVQDPVRLARSLERLVAEFTRLSTASGKPGPTLSWERRATARSITSAAATASDTFVLRATGAPFQAHLVFVDGYMLVTASEQMLQRAVRARQGGQVLRGSWRFQQLLPPDREANFSAVVYHNLGEAASAVAGWLGGSGALHPEQQQGLDRLVQDAKPGLFYVYGGVDDIQVASTGGFFGVTLDHVLGSAGLADLLDRNQGRPRPR